MFDLADNLKFHDTLEGDLVTSMLRYPEDYRSKSAFESELAQKPGHIRPKSSLSAI